MKLNKIIGVSALAAVLALTGCGKEDKLVCTQSEENASIETVIKFDGDNVKSIDMTTTFEDDEYVDFMEAMYTQLEYNVKRDGKKLIIKLTAEELEEELGHDAVASKKDIKKALEEGGFTCK